MVLPNNDGWHHCHGRDHGDEWWGWGNDDTAGVGSKAVGGKKGSDEGQRQGWVVADEVVQVGEEGVCADGLRVDRSCQAQDGQDNSDAGLHGL